MPEDEKAKVKWVQHYFESLIENHTEYQTLVLHYFSQYYYVEKNNFDFKTRGDYYHYLNDNDILSLKGDKVKSFGELYIANWLFYHGIDYVYEATYQLMSSYNNHLRQRDEVDFEDMIVKATEYVEAGLFTSPWRYIMVDELQDISESRARLVKALRDSRKSSSVFAVGNDWQVIYRFSDADIRLTTQFTKYFGLTTQTELGLTFRY